jgi:hypothetical protein
MRRIAPPRHIAGHVGETVLPTRMVGRYEPRDSAEVAGLLEQRVPIVKLAVVQPTQATRQRSKRRARERRALQTPCVSRRWPTRR